MKYTNKREIPIALAVWLVDDDYDYQTIPWYLSATTLLKPIKQIILGFRAAAVAEVTPSAVEPPDLEELIARKLGGTIHSGIEQAWLYNAQKNLKTLGYSDEVLKRILVNPTQEQIDAVKDPVIVWIEQRSKKRVGKWTIGGKFDFVIEGNVEDTKTTTAFSWMFGTRDEEHLMQGSIYKWLNPDKIVGDLMRINYVFTDWSKKDALSNPKYPQCRLLSKVLELKTTAEMQVWIERRLALLEKYWDAPEEQIPECTAEEMWLTDPQFRYYADAAGASLEKRSTKNFDNLSEAQAYAASKGKGIVLASTQEAKRCGKYCNGSPLCTQKERYIYD